MSLDGGFFFPEIRRGGGQRPWRLGLAQAGAASCAAPTLGTRKGRNAGFWYAADVAAAAPASIIQQDSTVVEALSYRPCGGGHRQLYLSTRLGQPRRLARVAQQGLRALH